MTAVARRLRPRHSRRRCNAHRLHGAVAAGNPGRSIMLMKGPIRCAVVADATTASTAEAEGHQRRHHVCARQQRPSRSSCLDRSASVPRPVPPHPAAAGAPARRSPTRLPGRRIGRPPRRGRRSGSPRPARRGRGGIAGRPAPEPGACGAPANWPEAVSKPIPQNTTASPRPGSAGDLGTSIDADRLRLVATWRSPRRPVPPRRLAAGRDWALRLRPSGLGPRP